MSAPRATANLGDMYQEINKYLGIELKADSKDSKEKNAANTSQSLYEFVLKNKHAILAQKDGQKTYSAWIATLENLGAKPEKISDQFAMFIALEDGKFRRKRLGFQTASGDRRKLLTACLGLLSQHTSPAEKQQYLKLLKNPDEKIESKYGVFIRDLLKVAYEGMTNPPGNPWVFLIKKMKQHDRQRDKFREYLGDKERSYKFSKYLEDVKKEESFMEFITKIPKNNAIQKGPEEELFEYKDVSLMNLDKRKYLEKKYSQNFPESESQENILKSLNKAKNVVDMMKREFKLELSNPPIESVLSIDVDLFLALHREDLHKGMDDYLDYCRKMACSLYDMDPKYGYLVTHVFNIIEKRSKDDFRFREDDVIEVVLSMANKYLEEKNNHNLPLLSPESRHLLITIGNIVNLEHAYAQYEARKNPALRSSSDTKDQKQTSSVSITTLERKKSPLTSLSVVGDRTQPQDSQPKSSQQQSESKPKSPS